MTRRGAMMIELAVAGAMLGTLLVVCLQLLSAAATQRRAADQRQSAVLELGNVMERVAARPWAELSTDSLAGERLSPSADGQLPGAELKIEVAASADEPNAKRITVTLRWQGLNGQPIAPLTLTTWRYNAK